MTRTDAIKFYTDEILLLKLAPKINGDSGMDEEWKRQIEIHEMAIAALREQPRWISVTERMPERNERVLCRYTFGEKGQMFFYQVLDYYATDPQPHFQHTLGDAWMRVTHWMPLPQRPEVEG